MKKLFKALGTTAMLAALVLSFAACENILELIGDDKNTDTYNLGKTLTLSGQVYEIKGNYDPPSVSFEAYKEGDLTVSAYGMTEKGTIKNGQLSITLGTPTSLDDIDDGFIDDDMTVSPSNAKGFVLSYLYCYIENSDGRRNLARGNYSIAGTTSETQEMVQYFYVDRDVTISSKEKTDNDYYGDVTEIYTTKAFRLALKTGWNTLYMKQQTSMNERSKTIERITTISLANPGNLKWFLGDSRDGSGESEGSGEGGGIGEEGDLSAALEGTWIAEEYDFDGDKVTYTLIFSTYSYSSYTLQSKTVDEETGEENIESWSGIYRVSGNTVFLYGDGMPEYGLSGTISGNRIVFSKPYPDSTVDLVFYKR